jgi:hypothetical protein
MAHVIEQILAGNRSICSLMIESNLEAGGQPMQTDIRQLKYGVSITDKCVDWKTTERMLRHAHMTGLAGVLTGAVLVPLLLPWLPGRMFAVKGAGAGLLVAAAGTLLCADRLGALGSAALLLALPAVAAWCAMHFTGATTFTSPSGVEREMRRTIPWQAAALLAGGICWVAGAFV